MIESSRIVEGAADFGINSYRVSFVEDAAAFEPGVHADDARAYFFIFSFSFGLESRRFNLPVDETEEVEVLGPSFCADLKLEGRFFSEVLALIALDASDDGGIKIKYGTIYECDDNDNINDAAEEPEVPFRSREDPSPAGEKPNNQSDSSDAKEGCVLVVRPGETSCKGS